MFIHNPQPLRVSTSVLSSSSPTTPSHAPPGLVFEHNSSLHHYYQESEGSPSPPPTPKEDEESRYRKDGWNYERHGKYVESSDGEEYDGNEELVSGSDAGGELADKEEDGDKRKEVLPSSEAVPYVGNVNANHQTSACSSPEPGDLEFVDTRFNVTVNHTSEDIVGGKDVLGLEEDKLSGNWDALGRYSRTVKCQSDYGVYSAPGYSDMGYIGEGETDLNLESGMRCQLVGVY